MGRLIEILLLLIIKVKASRDWWVDEPTYHLEFNISFQIKNIVITFTMPAKYNSCLHSYTVYGTDNTSDSI